MHVAVHAAAAAAAPSLRIPKMWHTTLSCCTVHTGTSRFLWTSFFGKSMWKSIFLRSTPFFRTSRKHRAGILLYLELYTSTVALALFFFSRHTTSLAVECSKKQKCTHVKYEPTKTEQNEADFWLTKTTRLSQRRHTRRVQRVDLSHNLPNSSTKSTKRSGKNRNNPRRRPVCV